MVRVGMAKVVIEKVGTRQRRHRCRRGGEERGLQEIERRQRRSQRQERSTDGRRSKCAVKEMGAEEIVVEKIAAKEMVEVGARSPHGERRRSPHGERRSG
jgi:hypothetical protein